MTQGRFILDLDRCTGCSACVIACRNENPVSEGLAWRSVFTFNSRRLSTQPMFHYSLACNHCLEPACLFNCPSRAYEKDHETGAVILDPQGCMGCGYCSWVCPYDAPQLNVATGVMEKCTFCNQRQVAGQDPACTVACPTDALQFDAHGEWQPVERPGFPDTGLRPSIAVRSERRSKAPAMTFGNCVEIFDSFSFRSSWRGLRREWSLWVFTSIATLLVAWFAAAASLGELPPLPVFVSCGLIGMVISALHLGRPNRLLRSVLGFGSSWISREVVFWMLFFFGACFVIVRGSGSPLVWPVVVCGFAALFSMDMVYRVPGSRIRAVPHSAMTLLTAVLYVGILTGLPLLVVAAASVKAVLYLVGGRAHPGGSLWVVVRLISGLLFPVTAGLSSNGAPILIVMICALIGELMDRAELYAGLSFVSPRRQIDDDLRCLASSSAG